MPKYGTVSQVLLQLVVASDEKARYNNMRNGQKHASRGMKKTIETRRIKNNLIWYHGNIFK